MALRPLDAAKLAGQGTDEVFQNRFLLTSVAFLRAKQLQGGARPRIDTFTHKNTQLAVLEVLADRVSWSVADALKPVEAA